MGIIIIHDHMQRCPTQINDLSFIVLPCKDGLTEEQIRSKVERRIRKTYEDAQHLDGTPLRPSVVAHAVMAEALASSVCFWTYQDWDRLEVGRDWGKESGRCVLFEIEERVQRKNGWTNI